MKKHNIFKVVGITILVALLLTWILPVTSFNYNELASDGTRSQVGLFNLLSYPTVSLSYFGNVALYLLAIGGFYGILYKIGAYRSLLDNIAKKAKGKEKIILSCIMILLAAFTSVCGASQGLWIIIPFIVSLVLIMGYDKITAAMVTVGSIVVGMIGSTLSSIYIADEYGSVAAQNGMGIVNTILETVAFKGITIKQILLVVALFSLMYVVFSYIKKEKSISAVCLSLIAMIIVFVKIYFINIGFNALPFKPLFLKILFTAVVILIFVALLVFISYKYLKSDKKIIILILSIAAHLPIIVYLFPEIGVDISKIFVLLFGLTLLVFNTLTFASKNQSSKKIAESDLIPVEADKKMKKWPIIVVMDLVFIITLLSLTSWTSVFKLNWFSDATTAVLTKAKIAGFPIFGKILGNIAAFEQWGLTEITSLIVIASIVIALFYRVKFNEYIDNAIDGIKKALKPAAIVLAIYIVLIIVTYNPILLTIFKPLIKAGKLNAPLMSLVAFIASLANVDLLYAASSTLPYVAQVIPGAANHAIIAFIWQTMYGFATLIAPTSVILMATLSYLDISYGKWIKSNWKLILEILVCCIVISTILVIRL